MIMEINLEKIELVKDRTGASYAEAKEALEAAEGSVVDAIIAIEEKLNKDYESVDGASLKDSPVFEKLKEIVDKGNVTRILITKDDTTIVNFPVTIGVVGAVLVPWGAILGIAAAVGTKCSIDFVKEDGEVVDINGKVVGAYDKAKGFAKKGADIAQETLAKVGVDSEKVEKVGSQLEDLAYKTSDKVNELGEKGADKVSTVWDRLEESGTFEELKKTFESGTAWLMDLWNNLEKGVKEGEAEETAETVSAEAADTAVDTAEDAADKPEDAAEQSAETTEEAADEAAE
jgi:hypothetical protein